MKDFKGMRAEAVLGKTNPAILPNARGLAEKLLDFEICLAWCFSARDPLGQVSIEARFANGDGKVTGFRVAEDHSLKLVFASCRYIARPESKVAQLQRCTRRGTR